MSVPPCALCDMCVHTHCTVLSICLTVSVSEGFGCVCDLTLFNSCLSRNNVGCFQRYRPHILFVSECRDNKEMIKYKQNIKYRSIMSPPKLARIVGGTGSINCPLMNEGCVYYISSINLQVSASIRCVTIGL